MASDLDWVEPPDALSAPTLDMHRGIGALVSTLQQLDAANLRHEACSDPALRLILAMHCDQYKGQVARLLEWARRRDVRLDHEFKHALFKAGPITAPIRSDEP
jgi:hypothetical protein